MVVPGRRSLGLKNRSVRRWIAVVLVLAVAAAIVGLWIYRTSVRSSHSSSQSSCGTVGAPGDYVENYPRLYVTVPPSQKAHLTCFLNAVSTKATASLEVDLNGIDTNSVSVLRTQAGRISEAGTYRVAAGDSTSKFADVCTLTPGETPPTLNCGTDILIFGPYHS